MGKKFNDFVNKMNERAKEKKTEFDPAARIKSFKDLVSSLYADIDNWLEEGLQAETIKTGIDPITITEELLGAYQTFEKWIQIGNARITFHPVGTIMIGTDARIDMKYRSREVMIVRTGENIEGPGNLISVQIVGEPARRQTPAGKPVWKYVKDRQRLSYVTLNKDSFENLLMDLVNETN